MNNLESKTNITLLAYQAVRWAKSIAASLAGTIRRTKRVLMAGTARREVAARERGVGHGGFDGPLEQSRRNLAQRRGWCAMMSRAGSSRTLGTALHPDARAGPGIGSGSDGMSHDRRWRLRREWATTGARYRCGRSIGMTSDRRAASSRAGSSRPARPPGVSAIEIASRASTSEA